MRGNTKKLRCICKGEKFGKWSVTETADCGRIKCRCECGVESVVKRADLIHGNSKSCRTCYYKSEIRDFVGLVFGFLTVEKFAYYKKTTRNAFWQCVCCCGNRIVISAYRIKIGRTKSCGCESRTLTAAKLSLPQEEANARVLFTSYKKSAKNRNLNFELTLDEFRNFIFKNCFYCGSKPRSLCRTHVKFNNIPLKHNGIDRKDNSLGYEVDNCVACCKICNRAKSNMLYDEFLEWIENLINYNNFRAKK